MTDNEVYDLSQTGDEVQGILNKGASLPSNPELQAALAGKQDVIPDLSTIRQNAQNGQEAYEQQATVVQQAAQAVEAATDAEHEAQLAQAAALAAAGKLEDLETFLQSLDPESAASVAAELGLFEQEVRENYAKKTECVFDISAYHATGTPPVLAIYADLTAALGTDGENIPEALRKGGMSVKFVQGTEHSSDNKYVQYRYTSDDVTTATFTNTDNWAVCDVGIYIDSPEFVKVYTDSNNKILWAIKTDGGIYFGAGVPQQVIDYVNTHGYTKDVVDALLNGKVDKEIGKSLIPIQYIQEADNPEFSTVCVDNDNRILFGVKTDGDFFFGYGVPNQVVDYINTSKAEIQAEIQAETTRATNAENALGTFEECPEYLKAIIDNAGKVLIGIKDDGDVIFGTGVPSLIAESITNSINNVAQAKNNIIYRQRYTGISSNIEEVVDISNRMFGNSISVGVFTSDYKNGTKAYNVLGSTDNITYSSLAANRYTNQIYTLSIDSSIKYLKIVTTNIVSADSLAVGVNVWNRCNATDIIVAANNSTATFKRNAHFVCDGVNDEVELDEAFVLSNWNSTVYLGNGYFYIDSFIHKNYTYLSTDYSDYSVLTNFSYGNLFANRSLVGVGKSVNEQGKGTRIYVRESAFTNIPAASEPYVVGGAVYGSSSRIIVKNISIKIENNQHKVVCINGQYLGALIVNSVSLSAGENAWSETLPAVGCVGLRGVRGDSSGTDYVLTNTYAIAFHVGFQLGGEHLVAYELGTRFCYYGYTFGEYDYGSWINAGEVTDSHALILLKITDEGSRALPKFVKSGMYDVSNARAKQYVYMNLTMEVHTSSLIGATEVTSGAFCGIINFTAYGSSNTSKNTDTGSDRRNRIDCKFWASDSDGIYFTTRNMAHAEQGTTNERLKYWALKMQKYYDTDLNKMLVCTSEDNQEWRDFNGNIIQ